MDWTDKILRDMYDNKNVRKYLDEVRSKVYDLCTDFVARGATQEEAAVLAEAVIEDIQPIYEGVWLYFVEQWIDEVT